MPKIKEKNMVEDNVYMFKRLTSHKPSAYDDTPSFYAFEDCIPGIKKLFDVLYCLEEWRLGFAGFYSKR